MSYTAVVPLLIRHGCEEGRGVWDYIYSVLTLMSCHWRSIGRRAGEKAALVAASDSAKG